MGRTVKLGRKMLVGPVAHHWAVKAGDTWYEVAGASKNDKGAKMRVNRCVYLTFAVQGTARLRECFSQVEAIMVNYNRS